MYSSYFCCCCLIHPPTNLLTSFFFFQIIYSTPLRWNVCVCTSTTHHINPDHITKINHIFNLSLNKVISLDLTLKKTKKNWNISILGLKKKNVCDVKWKVWKIWCLIIHEIIDVIHLLFQQTPYHLLQGTTKKRVPL